MSDIRYSKTCPKCGNIVYYKTKGAYWANKNKNSKCLNCKYKEQSEKTRGMKRPPFSDEWKRNITIGHKKSKVWKASMNTPEYKEKHRQKMIRLIKENKSKVGYNPKACDVFDFINEKLRWSGLHAKNGKEQAIDTFFLDYYDPIKNIVIEWDEKHHKKTISSQRRLDQTKGCDGHYQVRVLQSR
jgi:hypothetical protein